MRTDITWWILGDLSIQISYNQAFYSGNFTPMSVQFHQPSRLITGDELIQVKELIVLTILNKHQRAEEIYDLIGGKRLQDDFKETLSGIHSTIKDEEDLPNIFYEEDSLREWMKGGGWNGMGEEERLMWCIKDSSVKKYWQDTINYNNRIQDIVVKANRARYDQTS